MDIFALVDLVAAQAVADAAPFNIFDLVLPRAAGAASSLPDMLTQKALGPAASTRKVLVDVSDSSRVSLTWRFNNNKRERRGER